MNQGRTHTASLRSALPSTFTGRTVGPEKRDDDAARQVYECMADKQPALQAYETDLIRRQANEV